MSPRDTPRVTIVCPCFDDGATLGETIGTLQESIPIDVVIVDDGSSDPATLEALRRLERDERVTVVRHPHNMGVAAGINSGLQAARTPFVFFMGADDHFVQGGIGALVDALDADPDAVAAWGHYEFFEQRTGLCRTPPWDPWRLTYNNYWTGVALVRTEPIRALGGASPDRLYEDWDLWLKVAGAGLHGVVIDRTVFRYRIRYKARRSNQAKDAFPIEYRNMMRAHAGLIARRSELAKDSTLTLVQRTSLRCQVRLNRLLPARVRAAVLRLRAARSMRRDRRAASDVLSQSGGR